MKLWKGYTGIKYFWIVGAQQSNFIVALLQYTFNLIFLDWSIGSEVKASASNAGDPGSIPGLGRSPGEGNGNPLQYSCLENPMDGEAWWATVHGVAKSQTWLSDLNYQLLIIIVALQCCVSFCCTAKSISCMYTYIPSFLDFLHI